MNSKLFPHHNSSQFTEFPSPAQRVACRWNHNCRSTNLKKFSKNEHVAAPGPRASRSSACSSSKRVGQKLAPAPYPALLPPSKIPQPNLHFLKGVDATALKGGREGNTRKNSCKFNFGQNYAKFISKI